MTCKHFGQCGSCKIYEDGYDAQLRQKVEYNKELFSPFTQLEGEVFSSPDEKFRTRAEFKIFHNSAGVHYAMYDKDKKLFNISECHIVSAEIQALMNPLLELVVALEISHKLFGVEFLSTTTNEMLVTLIYHKKLDELWQEKANTLLVKLGVSGIIGRSRKQKVIVKTDKIIEHFKVDEKDYKFIYQENSFTQPNPYTNQAMLNWVYAQSENNGKDLLELYCGAGNFTLVLSQHFEKVMATEISKPSIAAARENCSMNGVSNIEFIRMSSEDYVKAMRKEREFTRLKDIDLDEYNFSSIFVDPPRSGLDDTTRALSAEFEHILYISCNPETLARDVEYFKDTHNIVAMAFFDQFAYTPHLEMGLHLIAK